MAALEAIWTTMDAKMKAVTPAVKRRATAEIWENKWISPCTIGQRRAGPRGGAMPTTSPGVLSTASRSPRRFERAVELSTTRRVLELLPNVLTTRHPTVVVA